MPGPRPLRLLARLLLRPSEQEVIIGDLEELYARHAKERGVVFAGLHYLREVLSSAVSRAGDRGAVTPRTGSHRSIRSIALATRAFEELRFDLRFALHGLRRNSTFTVVAALTIAVGMGATTAMLSIANAVLLRPPPIMEPHRVLAIGERSRGDYRESIEGRQLSYDRYEAYKERTTDVFEDLAGHSYTSVAIAADDGAVVVNAFTTSGNYFAVLGLVPGIGRLFQDDQEESVVLSDRLWRSRYGADPTVVGRTISIDGSAHRWVAPTGFVGTMSGFTGDVWLPAVAYTRLAGLGTSYVVPIGRLRSGVDRALAEQRVSAAALAIPPASGTTVQGARLEGLLWRTDLREPITVGIGIIMGTAALLLLVACANIAGMMTARSYERRREVAVRLAIGAGGGRLARQMLVESVLLALIGGAGGILLASAGTAGLSTIAFPIDATITLDATPDLGVLVASFVLATLTGVLFGLGPALRSARTDLTTSLKEGAQGARLSHKKTAFLVGQLALSTLLLLTAGLFLRSYLAVADVPLGFEADGVTVASLSLATHGYSEEEGLRFYEELIDRVRAAPGVESASLGRFVLLGGTNASNRGRAVDAGQDAPDVNIPYNVVDPEYFRTNRMELVAGRFLTPSDAEDTPYVAVVTRRLRSACGRTSRLSDGLFVSGDASTRWWVSFATGSTSSSTRIDVPSRTTRSASGMEAPTRCTFARQLRPPRHPPRFAQ